MLVRSPQAALALHVDEVVGNQEVVVKNLGAQLNRVPGLAGISLLASGEVALIYNVVALADWYGVDARARLTATQVAVEPEQAPLAAEPAVDEAPLILVVDDSLTVRELERKLLDHHGFEVEVAVDGMDGWNAVRSDAFDLVVTDVDMPHMDGIELVTLIKRDPGLRNLPVMIVSYKDREEDRRRGLDAGADYYLTKGSFHDETLIHAVVDLIGEPWS